MIVELTSCWLGCITAFDRGWLRGTLLPWSMSWFETSTKWAVEPYTKIHTVHQSVCRHVGLANPYMKYMLCTYTGGYNLRVSIVAINEHSWGDVARHTIYECSQVLHVLHLFKSRLGMTNFAEDLFSKPLGDIRMLG